MPYRIIPLINGRRGGVLLISGIHCILLGLAYLLGPLSPSLVPTFGPQHGGVEAGLLPVHPVIFPMTWLGSGAVQVAGALLSRRWERAEVYGFAAAITLGIGWLCVFLLSAFLGNPYAWQSSAQVALYAFLMNYVAAWPNPASLRFTLPHIQEGRLEK